MSEIKKMIEGSGEEKKNSSEAKNQKTRFTVLDFFFIIVILLCVLGIGFRGTIAEFFLKAEPTQNVEISFKTNSDSLTENEVNGIEMGKEFFFDDKTHQTFGVVSQVELNPELMGFSATGKMTVHARYTDSGLVTKDNRSLRVGETFNICSGNYTVCVQITEIPRK